MHKHLGEQGHTIPWLASSAAVSVPMDLLACGTQLSDTTIGQRLYTRYFLKTMKAKISEKAKRFPGNIDVFRLSQCKTLREFDTLYTAPMHGYKNALDYWTRASSKPHLKSITAPTLILNARNDPFVPGPSLPCSDR